MQVRFGNTAQPAQLNRNLAIQNFNRTQTFVSQYLDYLEEQHGPDSTSNRRHITYLAPETMSSLVKATGVGPTTPGWNVMG